MQILLYFYIINGQAQKELLLQLYVKIYGKWRTDPDKKLEFET